MPLLAAGAAGHRCRQVIAVGLCNCAGLEAGNSQAAELPQQGLKPNPPLLLQLLLVNAATLWPRVRGVKHLQAQKPRVQSRPEARIRRGAEALEGFQQQLLQGHLPVLGVVFWVLRHLHYGQLQLVAQPGSPAAALHACAACC